HLENPVNNATLPIVYATNSNNVGRDLRDSVSSKSSVIVVIKLFMSKKKLQNKLSMLTVGENFDYNAKKSKKDLLVVICVNAMCQWHLRASHVYDTKFWRVNKFIATHSCSLSIKNHNDHQASS